MMSIILPSPHRGEVLRTSSPLQHTQYGPRHVFQRVALELRCEQRLPRK